MGADLFGVALHLLLGIWEQLNIISSIDLLGDDANLVNNGELKHKHSNVSIH